MESKIATRQAIQIEYLRLLNEENFSFDPADKEPRGVQKAVRVNLNKMSYGGQRFKVTKQLVSDWAARCRNNKYELTSVQADYSRSSQNSRKFFDAEQKRIRDKVISDELSCGDVTTVWSDKKGRLVSVSKSYVRRALKRKLDDEPSMIAAVPKGMRIGGLSDHHNRARLHEAKYWLSKPQEFIDNMWFADESKMTFKEHKNKRIDIKWIYRGNSAMMDSTFYEDPRWSGQIQWNPHRMCTCLAHM